MNDATIKNLSLQARSAVAKQDWATAHACADEILAHAPQDPEGLFLIGLVWKAAQRPKLAVAAFENALRINAGRYDAAVELASQYSMARRNAEVADLLERYETLLSTSPRYLDMAGTVYTEIGLPEKAYPLFVKANELQPNAALLQGNLAACAVHVGEIKQAKTIYQSLLKKNERHQRNHYLMARLEKTTDRDHIEQMERLLRDGNLPDDRNIYFYYALGKEYEDLGEWQQAFAYFKKAGDAVNSVSKYDVKTDLDIVDSAIEVCNSDWLNENKTPWSGPNTPLFIVGLPRTGTTLTERIITSHSQAQSVGETEFVQMIMRRESKIETIEKMTAEIIETFARKDISLLTNGYMDTVGYRLGKQPVFIDKLPFNVHYLGFIAKAWPNTPIVLLRRNPMDACFSMYKQVFTWAYKFSYDLESLARYYIAYDRLCQHWHNLLGDRLVVVDYEKLVTDQENQTRRLLDGIGLEFEQACLDFDQNTAPSATASSVQIREKVHTRSINKWQNYAKELQPLKDQLNKAGIVTD